MPNQRTHPPPDDWRRQGQERYLKGATLVLKDYQPFSDKWDHDHCVFCNAKFSLLGGDDLTRGYCTEDEYHWVCPTCYEDFKAEFSWK